MDSYYQIRSTKSNPLTETKPENIWLKLSITAIVFLSAFVIPVVAFDTIKTKQANEYAQQQQFVSEQSTGRVAGVSTQKNASEVVSEFMNDRNALYSVGGTMIVGSIILIAYLIFAVKT